MPDTITFIDNSRIVYIYDAGGVKLRKKSISKNRDTTITDYSGELEFTNRALNLIHTGEGVVMFSDVGEPSYQYFLKDHLGNTRVVIDQHGTVTQKTDYYPFGGTAWTASNSINNKYLYNGKEKQDEFGLDWYDYGARFYDPQIGRWHVIDKLSEHPNQIELSPYQYAWNNPVNLNDPDGNCPWCIIGAIVGAAVDYGSQVAANYMSSDFKGNIWVDNINTTSIITSGLSGAASGGLASLAKTGLISTTRAVAGNMTINAGESISKQLDEAGTVNLTKVALDVTAGQLADGLPTKQLVPTKQLENQLDRAIRVAGENPRPNRAAAVSSAQGKVNRANIINRSNSEVKEDIAQNLMQTISEVTVSNKVKTNNNNSSSAEISRLKMKPFTYKLVLESDNTKRR